MKNFALVLLIALAFLCGDLGALAKSPAADTGSHAATGNHAAPGSHAATGKSRFHPALFPKLVPLVPIMDKGVSEHTRLMSRVTHSESFPPLPVELCPGAAWDEDKVVDPAAKSENLWYKVPKWITGEFSYGTMVHYYLKNLQTGEETSVNVVHQPLPSGRNRGILVDKAGNIWQKAYGGAIGDPTAPKTKIEYEKYDDELVGFILGPDQYTENSAGIEFYIDRETNKILKVQRWQRIREFTFKDGNVMVALSEQTYNFDGKPLELEKAKGHMIRRQEFVPLAPGETDSVAGSYATAVEELRAFMNKIGEIAIAPDAEAEVSTHHKDARLIHDQTGAASAAVHQPEASHEK